MCTDRFAKFVVGWGTVERGINSFAEVVGERWETTDCSAKLIVGGWARRKGRARAEKRRTRKAFCLIGAGAH